MARMRQDEIRAMMYDYFKASLQNYLETMNSKGFSGTSLQHFRDEISVLDNAAEGQDSLADLYLDPETFCEATKLDKADWEENQHSLRREWRKGRRDMLKSVLAAAERLEHYDYSDTETGTTSSTGGVSASPTDTPAPANTSSALGAAIEDFIEEHSRQWAEKTTGQNRAYLNILLEYFGPDRLLGSISKQDANEVKKVLQSLPSNRNTKPALHALPLLEVIEVTGHEKISARTINSHIQMFKMFFDWAERHGYSPHTLFGGMKVKKPKQSETQRKPFTPEQAQTIHTELTTNPSGIVKNVSHKWGTLLGMYTGARLNEIAQLRMADVQQDENGIWFLNITDEDDDTQRIKTEAGRRKVPLHSHLIELGFLDFLESRRGYERLFPDFSYNVNGGYGRNLGRWCNETFLPKLGIKEPGLVFHSLRHTMVTRLSQAGVSEPIVQSLVGHARTGVTQEVYMREGYTLEQLKMAIEQFRV